MERRERQLVAYLKLKLGVATRDRMMLFKYSEAFSPLLQYGVSHSVMQSDYVKLQFQMGPKKKGKGSKLSRMSEEERIRYLQHRAAIEEEARRRKQQLIATFMKNKLKREEAFTRLNLAKINQQWRQILRNIKSSELKEELKALRDSFQHIINYKTQIVHTLLKDLDASEDQHNRILQSHTEAVDRLLQIHKDRLSHLHIIYKQQRKGLLRASGLENQQIVTTSEENEEYLNTLLFSIQESMENFQKTGEERQSTKLDEIRNELQFYQEQLENEKESDMEKIWREFQTVLKNYFTETEVSRTHYLRLKEKDSNGGKIIRDCSEKIENLTEQVNSLKLQLLNLRSSQDNTISGLNQEQNNLVKYFAELRKTMKSALQHDENQLTYMSVCSNKVISEIQVQVVKAEQIFNIFSICRKYETEREKVLPFGWDYLSSDEKSELELSVKQEINEPLAQEIFTYSKLDNFWLKYNNAALECAALKLHYNALKVDNQQLQATIRSYLALVTRGNGNRCVQMPLTGTRPNTRAVRKQITLITGEETKIPKPRPVTCIEASTSIAVQHMIRSKVL